MNLNPSMKTINLIKIYLSQAAHVLFRNMYMNIFGNIVLNMIRNMFLDMFRNMFLNMFRTISLNMFSYINEPQSIN